MPDEIKPAFEDRRLLREIAIRLGITVAELQANESPARIQDVITLIRGYLSITHRQGRQRVLALIERELEHERLRQP